MIRITPDISIEESELQEDFVRSSGPGGQNVNKVSTAVQLRFDAAGSTSLPSGVKQRLRGLAGQRMTKEGVLVIDARNHRTREKNRQEALERLIDLVRRATVKPKPRKKTKIPKAVHQRRIETKRKRGQKKSLRKPVRRMDD